MNNLYDLSIFIFNWRCTDFHKDNTSILCIMHMLSCREHTAHCGIFERAYVIWCRTRERLIMSYLVTSLPYMITLFQVPAHEVYIRSVGVVIILGFGLIAARLVGRREQAEQEVRRREQYYRSLIANLHEDVIVIERDWVVERFGLAKVEVAVGEGETGLVHVEPADPYERDRLDMVRYQLETRGISDPRVLEAMRSVRRDRFVTEELREVVYEDRVLPLRLRGRHAEKELALAVGDELSFDLEKGVVQERLPRRTQLARRRRRGEQVLAANMDRLGIVASFDEPPFRSGLIESEHASEWRRFRRRCSPPCESFRLRRKERM